MQEYNNENRGAIWKNDKKETDNHPDFTGSLNVGGVEYWVSAWKRKEDANPNAPALSFSVKIKEPKGDSGNNNFECPKCKATPCKCEEDLIPF